MNEQLQKLSRDVDAQDDGEDGPMRVSPPLTPRWCADTSPDVGVRGHAPGPHRPGQSWKTWRKQFHNFLALREVVDENKKRLIFLQEVGESNHELLETMSLSLACVKVGVGSSQQYASAIDKAEGTVSCRGRSS